jgi:hypothetical protein
LAYKLAREIDLDAGGVAAVRELRAILNAYKEARRTISPFSSRRVDLNGGDEEEEDTWHSSEAKAPAEPFAEGEGSAWPPEGGLWINGKKVH